MNNTPITVEKTLIKTFNEMGDAISNVVQLCDENKLYLELADKAYPYDNFSISRTPAIAVTFDTARMIAKSLGNLNGRRRCNLMEVDLSLYFYFETLNLSRDTIPHLGRINNLAKVLYNNPTLYGLCHSELMSINNINLVARRLQTNVYLTGQVDITVPIRFFNCERT